MASSSSPPTPTTTRARAQSFNSAAAQYAANRPSYPPALLDAIESFAGRPLAGARVADIGAGTGIATALLHARGAQVVAVEPGECMAAQLRRTVPGVMLVRGDGNHLPLATASLDLLTYAQAWHWTDPAHSVPEAVRVLRPGGVLALWWNTSDLDVPWIEAQADRIERHFGVDGVVRKNGAPSALSVPAPSAGSTSAPDPTGTLDFTRRRVRWSRRVSVDVHLANISSHSIFLVDDEESRNAFLAAERERLLAAFPDGTVEETYVVELLLATSS